MLCDSICPYVALHLIIQYEFAVEIETAVEVEVESTEFNTYFKQTCAGSYVSSHRYCIEECCDMPEEKVTFILPVYSQRSIIFLYTFV